MWCSAADTHIRLLDRVVSGANLLAGCVVSVTFLILTPELFCVSCIRSAVTRPMHPLCGTVPVAFCISAGYMWCLSRSYLFTCTSSLPNITIPRSFFLTRYFYGAILVTACSKGRCGTDGFLRAGSMLWVGLSRSPRFYLPTFYLPLPSFYGLIVWSWDVCTDRVHPPSPGLAIQT